MKARDGDHAHEHDRLHGGHSHVHGIADPSLFSTERGVWAVKWSFAGLALTALIQIIIYLASGSVALLADTIHNFADAATAVPLWVAFSLARLGPTRRFTYGLGRVEDLAGVAIVLVIAFSAAAAAWQSVDRLLHPETVDFLWAVALAAGVGFAGNEAVANLRIKVGREIQSAALVADGHHARVDGLASLGVLAGAAGVWLGFPLADPIAGLVITAFIARIVWDSARAVFTRLLDGVDPEVIDEIRHAVGHAKGVEGISEIRTRWLGHRLHAEVNISVGDGLSVDEGHGIAMEARHSLLHRLSYLSNATIHVDPVSASGEDHHSVRDHAHDDLPNHSHG